MITLILKHRFIFAPVLLSSISHKFAGFEHIFKFYALVSEYMPEEKEKMLTMDPHQAAEQFVKVFSKRYFDIKPQSFSGMVWEDHRFRRSNVLSDLVRGITLQWHGMTEWGYEPTRGISPGQLLAESICTCPFEGQRNDRIAVLTQFTKVVGEEAAEPLIKLLPSRGCKIEDVEEALKDSPYPGLLPWCQWVFHRTGNRWLDTTHGGVDWSREPVQELTRQYPEYLKLDKQMKAFDSWLGHDKPGRSAEVIRYVANKVKHHNDSLLINVLAGGVK